MTVTPFELDRDQGTGSSGVELPRSPSTTMATLTREFGILRDKTSILDADVGTDHRAAQLRTLELLGRDRARSDVVTLLDELAARRGLGWSDIARLVGVSVQAVRKWRKGESASGENRLAVARVAAFLDILDDIPIADPAGWLEVPVVDGYSLRHLDVFALGRPELLFELAGLRLDAEVAMKEISDDWRERYRMEHELVEAEDGQRSVRARQ